MLLEIAAAVLLVGWVAGPVVLVPAVVVAAVLVALATVRRRGRSLPEWLSTARALKARQRRAANAEVPPGTEPGLAPVLECAPALRTYSHGVRDRRPVGIIGDGTFVTAVVHVEADFTALRAERSRQPLPLGLVRDALEVDGIRLESAQIVLHTQPAPALHLPPQSVAVANYAPLQEQTEAPAVRITWIALKLDPELCPEAVAARGGGLAGAQKCVARAAHHLASRLTGAGFRTTVLDEEELIAALATSACANPLVTAEAGRTGTRERRTEESGRSWRCDNRRHTTYWIRRWPGTGGAAGCRCPSSWPGSPPFRRSPPPSASRWRTRRDRRSPCPGICGSRDAATTNWSRRAARWRIPHVRRGRVWRVWTGNSCPRCWPHCRWEVRGDDVHDTGGRWAAGPRRGRRGPGARGRSGGCSVASDLPGPGTGGTDCPWTRWTRSRCRSATTGSSRVSTPTAGPRSSGSTGPRRTTSS
ncbi:hypothetical protein SHKM778_21980 [Streptomyces sp. KM77-8]|uniref:Type VII secretion system protein EccE domain-containing protein n=1 Tax=Streptomyces haneummycinicus TaxID=3074435 RepID=A0AAT9HF65_9ACTN